MLKVQYGRPTGCVDFEYTYICRKRFKAEEHEAGNWSAWLTLYACVDSDLMLFVVKFVVSFFQQLVNMLKPSRDKYLTVKNRMHFIYNTQFVLFSAATVQPFRSGNLCHYVYLQAKEKRAERSVSGGGILKGECFIFLQQNSLIFFHSGTKQTTTRTARQEQQKFRQKECWDQNGKKKKCRVGVLVCVCATVCVV